MVKIIFMFLCGCLYLIGLPFGWTYKESSVYICIYFCPILCDLCAFISLFSCNIKTFWGRFRFSVNLLLFMYYIGATKSIFNHYSVSDPFELCMNDITKIANSMHISYEACNLWIYCFTLGLIVFFHLGQFYFFKRKK